MSSTSDWIKVLAIESSSRAGDSGSISANDFDRSTDNLCDAKKAIEFIEIFLAEHSVSLELVNALTVCGW